MPVKVVCKLAPALISHARERSNALLRSYGEGALVALLCLKTREQFYPVSCVAKEVCFTEGFVVLLLLH